MSRNSNQLKPIVPESSPFFVAFFEKTAKIKIQPWHFLFFFVFNFDLGRELL